LSIVGDGPELGNLKRQAKGLKVKFLGQMEGNKLVQEMKKADLYVMPSRVEGMPIRLLEAWAAKIPVVVTDVGDNAKYIIEEKNGFLSDVNSNSIKDAISRAIRSKNLNSMAESGYKKVLNYSWDKIAEQTLKAYREVL
jgi:glycosyltransferase involved in cell wall biosynthesis